MPTRKATYSIAFYKPYNVLSQWSKEIATHHTLADYLGGVESDVYPIGRLDRDSEGLLLLSNDTTLNHRLLAPGQHVEKQYYVQVDGAITQEALMLLQQGVNIRAKKKAHVTKPCVAALIEPPAMPERDPPIRYRASIPTSWISIIISEGKNRQIRKMCAAVGYPVLRLVRWRVAEFTLGDLSPGSYKEIKL